LAFKAPAPKQKSCFLNSSHKAVRKARKVFKKTRATRVVALPLLKEEIIATRLRDVLLVVLLFYLDNIVAFGKINSYGAGKRLGRCSGAILIYLPVCRSGVLMLMTLASNFQVPDQCGYIQHAIGTLRIMLPYRFLPNQIEPRAGLYTNRPSLSLPASAS
jgi:hypothetical protein